VSAISRISFVHSITLGGVERTYLDAKDIIPGRGQPEMRHEGAEVVLILRSRQGPLDADVIRVPISNVRWYAEAPPEPIAYGEGAVFAAPKSVVEEVDVPAAVREMIYVPPKRSHKRKPPAEEPQS
jgi:hypothetical protein